MELTSRGYIQNSISPSYIGYVSLTVSDLETSINFYHSVIGLHVLVKTDLSAVLGMMLERPLLILTQGEDTTSQEFNATGMDHFAILVPNRIELAKHLGRIIERNYPIQMITDHGVNESFYVNDPDNMMVEITRDFTPEELAEHRPLSPQELALQLMELNRQLKPTSYEVPDDTKIGHVLLRVSNLAQAEQFYNNDLGFDVSMRLPGAVFVSAGGYHHHVGFHVWESDGAPRPEISAIGLRYFSIICKSPCDFQFVRDPSGNGVIISSHKKPKHHQLIEFDRTYINRRR